MGAGGSIALICVAGALASPPKATIVDQIVAVVDKEIVTESELLIEARVALVAREQGRGYALADGPLDRELLDPTRDYLINQVLIASHVRRLGTVEVSDQEVDRALEQFIGYFPSDAAYQAFKRKYGIPEETIRDILRRDLRNERYIDQRMRIWMGGAMRSDRGDDHQREARVERAERALKRWLSDLRKGAEVRLLGPEGELEVQ